MSLLARIGTRSWTRGFTFVAALALIGGSARALDPLGPLEPNREEQHGIYVLNRARANPERYGRQIGVDLSRVARRPALAVNRSLTGACRFHAREMLENDYFSHTSQVTGDGPNQMALQHGYDLDGGGLGRDLGTANNIESIAFGDRAIPAFQEALALLIEDKGVPGLGHRVHLLATSAFYARHREVGCGRASSGQRHYYAIHSAKVSDEDRFVTGVVYDDVNGNGRYDRGEGLGGVTVQAGAASVLSMTHGGYSIPVAPGTLTVTAQGGAFRGNGAAAIAVGEDNVAVDFRSGIGGAQVDFVDVDAPSLPGPVVSVATGGSIGIAPFDVDFSAAADVEGTTFEWDFGDGSTTTGAGPAHRFEQPGLYPVVLSGTDSEGVGQALDVIAVWGAEGAGPGTAAPTSTDLFVKKAKIRVKFNKPGKDLVVLKGEIEMPAGFVPAERDVVVCLAGVRVPFLLTEKNKAVDASKNKVALKYKRPKGALPLEAGVRAKLVVKLKGDFAASLGAAGFRDTSETRTLVGVPFAFLLGEQAYRGTRNLSQKSKAGLKSSASQAD